MAKIIDPAVDTTVCNSIRRLIGGVDEDVLSDDDILDPAIVMVAESYVMGLCPDYSQLGPECLEKVKLATVYVLASLLCPSMASRVEIEVKTIETQWKRKAVDYGDLADSLMNIALNLLDDCCGGGGVDSPVFTIAPSKRKVRLIEEGKGEDY